MSNSTAFCYTMFIVRENEKKTKTSTNLLESNKCFSKKLKTQTTSTIPKKQNYVFFGLGRYGYLS